jgi:hypothetical protein
VITRAVEREVLRDLSPILSNMIGQLLDSIRRADPERAVYLSRLLDSITRLKRLLESGSLRKITPEEVQQFKKSLTGLLNGIKRLNQVETSDLSDLDRSLIDLTDVMK